MTQTTAIEPGPGQESVWDYPRPPRLEPVRQTVRVVFAETEIVSTADAYRVLETSHPPTYYLPPGDFVEGVLRPVPGGGTFCEWKGRATYYDVKVGEAIAPRAAWCYPDPTPAFRDIAGYVCLYCAAMDACYVGDAQATPQPGEFYGGWVTPDVVGPFKGEPGTMGW